MQKHSRREHSPPPWGLEPGDCCSGSPFTAGHGTGADGTAPSDPPAPCPHAAQGGSAPWPRGFSEPSHLRAPAFGQHTPLPPAPFASHATAYSLASGYRENPVNQTRKFKEQNQTLRIASKEEWLFLFLK